MLKKEKQLIYFFTFAVNYNLDSDDIAFTKTVLSIKPKSVNNVNNRKAFHKPRKPWLKIKYKTGTKTIQTKMNK